MSLYERIQGLCLKKGITIRQLSEKLDIGETTIYKWKNQTAKGETLERLANYFDVSVDYLLGRTDKDLPFDRWDKSYALVFKNDLNDEDLANADRFEEEGDVNVFNNIKEIASKQGITIRQVSKMADVSESTIYRWRDTKPSTRSLAKVADVLNVDVETLLAKNESESMLQIIQRKANKLDDNDKEKLIKLIDLTFKIDDKK